MLKICKLTTVFIGLLLCTNAFADSATQQDLYQVEIIVFTYNNPLPTPELWPEITSIPAIAGATNITEIPSSSWQLVKEEKRLRNNGNYNIIFHKAWLQQIRKQPQRYAIPVHIFGGNNYADIIEPVWQINGTLTLTKNTYINVATNLLLTETKSDLPSSLSNYPTSPFDSNLVTFNLHKKDRMRSGEPLYFDHPLFGMLVYIEPYEGGEQIQINDIKNH